jgi:hypothetical protein
MAVVDSEVAWEAVTGPDATDRFADGTIVLQWCAMSLSQLLADVHAAPDDDAPRLVYTDAV